MCNTGLQSIADECDIGKLLETVGSSNMHNLSREEKYRIFIKEPNPDPSVYPRSRSCDSAPFRQFQSSWLKQYPWAHYSPYCDGVFCRACAFFAPESVGGRKLGQFVTKPFKSWGNKTQKMNNHNCLDYHLTACAEMSEFVVKCTSPSDTIDTRLDNEAKKQLKSNQQVIESLLKGRGK